MGRKNNAARQRNSKGRLNRREKGSARMPVRPVNIPRVDVEELVMPDGQCLRNPRFPKAKFNTEEKAALALRQAQRMRARRGSGHVEKRYYLCYEVVGQDPETGEDITVGCGGYHLTSRETYEPAWKRGQA